jgi:hypothetical protein
LSGLKLIIRHCCSATDHAEDLRIARQEVIQLQHKVRKSQDGKLAQVSTTHIRADEVALLQSQCTELTAMCKRLEAISSEATMREELWRTKYEKSESNYAKLVEDRAHWHKREINLGRSWLELEEQLHLVTKELSRLKKKVETKRNAAEPPKAKFGAVLIEFTATVVSFSTP